MSLLFKILSRSVIAFLPRSSHLISWLQSPSAMILEPNKRKSVTASILSLPICHEVMGLDAMILFFFFFLIFIFKLAFSFSSFTLNKRFFSSSSLYAIRVVSPAYLRLLIFFPTILILACNSSSLAFCMMHCTCKLYKRGDNKQLYHMAFSILNLSIVTDRVLTWSTHSFLRRQIRRFGIPISKSFPQFIIIHTVKGVD